MKPVSALSGRTSAKMIRARCPDHPKIGLGAYGAFLLQSPLSPPPASLLPARRLSKTLLCPSVVFTCHSCLYLLLGVLCGQLCFGCQRHQHNDLFRTNAEIYVRVSFSFFSFPSSTIHGVPDLRHTHTHTHKIKISVTDVPSCTAGTVTPPLL